MTTVKNVIHSIANPLTYICNLSFTTGAFPQKMKMAKVIPLYRSGDSKLYSNYRPVSLLCQFSKVLEKLFEKRLKVFLEKFNILSDSQYGFREQRPTALALLDLTEEISSYIDKSNHVIGVFVDLKKAFDTINHDILFMKMERYGIRGIFLEWLKSYMGNRKPYVQIRDYRSSSLDITVGVPQGSALGPTLFTLFINDLCMTSKKLKFILFADDTNILCSGKKLRNLMHDVMTELTYLNHWFRLNKLSINMEKPKYILFGNKKTKTEERMIIDNNEIERLTETKFLGVILDEQLNWKPQIKNIKIKLAKSVGLLNKTKLFLNYKARYILYSSLVMPHLSYCVEIWGNTYPSNLQS
uniref:Reverse transcriptase domain-containing protein n=1 Tax=Salarias fasciatus TaxID=181472 RepID=A0A672F466_SALFA